MPGPDDDYADLLQPLFREAFGRGMPRPSMSADQLSVITQVIDILTNYEPLLNPRKPFSPHPQLLFDLTFLHTRALRGHTR